MTLWEQLLLRSVGPLETAVVGSLIIGLIVASITRRAQDHRADNELRFELIGEMTQTASGLYMALQHYWRKRFREKVGDEELAEHRKDLDQQYRESRVASEKIERQLEAYFVDDSPRRHWHAVMDLLTVRYFQLIDLANQELLKENARNEHNEHSGLTLEDLEGKSSGLILRTYRERLPKAARAVLQERLRPLSR